MTVKLMVAVVAPGAKVIVPADAPVKSDPAVAVAPLSAPSSDQFIVSAPIDDDRVTVSVTTLVVPARPSTTVTSLIDTVGSAAAAPR